MKKQISEKIEGIIFDWAGTVIDYGCYAPLYAFKTLFESKGINLTNEEINLNMGIPKDLHIIKILEIPRVKNQFYDKFGKNPDEEIYKTYHVEFEEILIKNLKNHCDEIPNAFSTIKNLKNLGIKIGSCSGYSRKLLNVCVEEVKNHYSPDFVIASDEVPRGRPYSYMIFANATKLEINHMAQIVKVGDTVSDMIEGRNAGVWTVGVLTGSNIIGYEKGKWENLKDFEKANIKLECKESLLNSGADYVIDSISDLPELINEINSRLLKGDHPGNYTFIPNQPYLIFTPGPMTLSKTVKLEMMTDWGSRENDYLELVQNVRSELVKLSTKNRQSEYTAVIIQGSGTFAVESTLTTSVSKTDKVLVLVNGQYGLRMVNIMKISQKQYASLEYNECEIIDTKEVDEYLSKNPEITHVAFVHCETTTGILNPLANIMEVINKHKKISIVDSMSGFGAIPLDVGELNIDYLVTSSNKNLQGVPGFGICIAKKESLNKCKGNATTLSLDLYDQYTYLDKTNGGFRFTSPVHVVRALNQAIIELKEEGGIEARFKRYSEMQSTLSEEMVKLGFKPLDLKGYQSPIITTFHNPTDTNYDFEKFYNSLKEKKCIIYPGKLTKLDTFRIGTIGALTRNDVLNLLVKIKSSITWKQ